MMFNFLKKKKPIARFYSLQEGVADLHPIIPTASVKRPWIKLPSNQTTVVLLQKIVPV